jgi:hypothetical protein
MSTCLLSLAYPRKMALERLILIDFMPLFGPGMRTIVNRRYLVICDLRVALGGG